MSLDRLTIVIPTYKRGAYIKRAMEYWAATPVHLLVLDGSEKPVENAEYLQSSERVSYVHAPIPIEERLGNSVSLVETEYAALISDDEFFLLSTLEKCVEFLDTHRDYSACKGLAMGYDWNNGYVRYEPMNRNLINYQVNSEDPATRMYEHLTFYAIASLWSVQRREVFATCMSAVASGALFSTSLCTEVQVSLVTAYMGKIKVLQELMWLRSFENKSIWNTTHNLTMAQWWRDANYSEEHERFIDSIILALKGRRDSSPEKGQIESAIEALALHREEREQEILESAKKRVSFKVYLRKQLLSLLIKTVRKPSLLNEVRQKYPRRYEEVKAVHDRIYAFHKSKN